jgi:16S rRNA (guanine(966)-N(2))-methyltransferase RsmD
MSLRIIGGSARGRRLHSPDVEGLRPTSGRVRQVLFDLLGQRFEGGAVLDLYAGTGALALEAVSRGADSALCVDSSEGSLALCRENAAALGFAARLQTLRVALPAGLDRLPRSPRMLVLADAPYAGAARGYADLLRWLPASGILTPESRVVLEASRRTSFEVGELAECPGLRRIDLRRTGDTLLAVYAREE